MRSPFRYPGGKSSLVPILMPYIKDGFNGNDLFIDAFVGGGSVFLSALSSLNIRRLVLNDLDKDIAAFWSVLVDSRQAKALADRVKKTIPTIRMFTSLREATPGHTEERAFRALFFNRTTFSGISTAGPIGGAAQKSRWTVGCRWNGAELASRILRISDCFDTLVNCTVSNAEAWHLRDDGFLYADPPYVEKGGDLYPTKMSVEDHESLSAYLIARSGPWVLSYDNNSIVRDLYEGVPVFVPVPSRYSISGAGRKGWVERRELVLCGGGAQ